MAAAEHKQNFKLTIDTPYLALTGELWGVSYENFEENWPRLNSTALYDITCSTAIVKVEDRSYFDLRKRRCTPHPCKQTGGCLLSEF